MAYRIPADHFSDMPQPVLPTSAHLEPETVTRESDDSSVGSTSTPSSRRKGGSDGSGGFLKRAMSSPNVRGLGVEGIPMSAADKKRNKLGYHRTAVACGHCRRRKIRCIPAFEDTSGRCANCIRLKKDCQFYPVDQQTAPVSRRARTTSKTDAATDESESTSEVHGPLILKSSPGTQLKSQMNGLISSPLSPQDISGFPAYAGRGIRSESFTEYSQRHGLNPQFTQRMSVHDPALHGNPDTSSSQQSYYPQLPSHVMPSPLQSSPHPGLYDTRSQTLSSTHSWSSATGSEETHGPYTAFRAYSHPSSFRRASEPQHVAFGYRDNAEMYGHESYNRPYHDPPTYTGAEYTNQIPTTSTDHYPPTWYSSQGLPNVREEDDHMHRYSRDQP